MKAALIGMLAETSLHPGAGQSTGAIDLPVQREATTDYPVLVGSSLKGALRHYARLAHQDEQHIDRIFGLPERAGDIGISDGKLLLLPLRSLKHAYLWVTCPYLLERWRRDLKMCGHTPRWTIPGVDAGQVLTKAFSPESTVFLEEYAYTAAKPSDLNWDEFIDSLSSLIYHGETRSRLSTQLGIISDGEFHHFAQFGLTIRARNRLDEAKISRALWYEESLSPDTLLYFMCLARGDDAESLAGLEQLIEDRPYLQIGGNESVGEGWCVLRSNQRVEASQS